MHAVSVSGLKHNPAQALLQATSTLVVVLNRDQPDAVLIGLEEGGLWQAPGVRAALATAAETRADLDTLEPWLPSSSPTPAP